MNVTMPDSPRTTETRFRQPLCRSTLRLLLPLVGVVLCAALLATPAIAVAVPDPGVPSSNPAWSWISPTYGADSVERVSFVGADLG